MKEFLEICADSTFGPAVQSSSCRGGFDFTVLFEESILSILPAACFLVLGPLRALHLFKQKIKVRRSSLHPAKLGTIGVYVSLDLALLVLWSTNLYFKTRFSIALASLELVAALNIGLLSHLEHRKSVRPSFLITFYLFTSLILDIARVRTQWLLPANDTVAAILTSSVAVKVLMLILEAVQKRRILLSVYRDISPESVGSIFNRGLFWWLNGLLMNGFKRVISINDLFSITEQLASERLCRDLDTRWHKCNQRRKHALMTEVLIALRWNVLAIILPRLCLVALNVAQPFLINEAVRYIERSNDVVSDSDGYGLIAAFGFVYIGTAITTGWYQHLCFRLMAMVRGSLIAMIYDKMITLKSTKVNDCAATTLMGTDVDRIAETWYLLVADVWADVIQLGVAIWLLERQLGAVCIAPIIVTIVATVISAKVAARVTSRQKVWLEAIQDRINFTSEILSSMGNVKMLGLTDKMTAIIQAMRVRELDLSKRFRRLSSFNVCLVNLPQTFSQFLTFAAFAITARVQGSHSLSTSTTTTSLSILTLLSNPLADLLHAVPQGYAAIGCFDRVQELLLEESRLEQRSLGEGFVKPVDSKFLSSDRVSVDDGLELASLSNVQRQNSNKFPLNDQIVIKNGSFGWSETNPRAIKDVSLRIDRRTPLTIILGPVGCGKSTLLKAMLGETSFFDGSVFAKSPEIAFCDQTPWIINASIRVNIIGESSFEAAWYESTVKACALDAELEQMPNGDATIVGSKGVMLSGGQKQRLSIARAVYSRKQIAIFDDVFSGLDTATEQLVFSRVFSKHGLLRRIGTTIILATHSVTRLPESDHIIVLGKQGQIVEHGSFSILSTSGGYIQSLQRRQKNEEPTAGSVSTELSRVFVPKGTQDVSLEPEANRQTGDWRLYKYYTASLGWFSLIVFATFVAWNSTFGALQYVWLNLWSESNEHHPNTRIGLWLGVYALFGVLKGIGLALSVFYMYVVIVPKSAQTLHWAVLKAAMNAPMSFITATETGMLVNRFSQDMRLVDMTLPSALVTVFFQFAGCIAVAILVIVAVGYFAAALPFIVGVLYFVQRFYLRTSRQLRLLELESKAPIYSHFIESISGMVTIRAFGWVEAYKEQNLRLLDASQKPFYLLLCIQRWLILVLDLIVAALAILLISLTVALRSRINSGFLGIALVNVMSLGHLLAALIDFWTSLETSLGAIARIKDFSESTPSELLSGEDAVPGPEWPAKGSLIFEGVSASYQYNSPPVLNNITLSISRGQKIGVCGRTGSGKSSFLLSIVRMIDLTSGKITVDNLDISTLPRPIIRERLICLTQQPFIFTGSVRLNADPLGRVNDHEIVAALGKVGLWTLIVEKTGAVRTDGAVLDTIMDENFLSHGQRQLFCLARAMLKKGSILILDEPTSNVDIKTDAQMQAIIRSEFKHHTIIMVAHRLDSLLDFDRVAVLDMGSLVEFGEPKVLLERKESTFARLYEGIS